MKNMKLLQNSIAGILAATLASSADASSSDYLINLLNVTPAGGWVMASTNQFSDAWVTGAAAVPPTPSGPMAIVNAWSSFAWDSNSGNMLLWGGGHANYAGNEMYVWNGGNGAWSRGSLSSRTLGTVDGSFIVDNAAPQSAHTYDGNLYLPINNMFMTLGGAAYNSGGNFVTLVGATVERAGPWMWDPTKADPNMVGGTSGSGYDSSSPGGNMWINRVGSLSGQQGPSYVQNTSAYREENGQDVVYFTADSQASGFPSLYRYEVGDVRNGGSDIVAKVGVMQNAAAFTGSGTIDVFNGLYVRNSNSFADLAVWDLAKSNAVNPNVNHETAIDLVMTDGTDFVTNPYLAIEYDSKNNRFLLWDGQEQGVIYSTQTTFNPDGSLASVWLVDRLISATIEQPSGAFQTGVLGKWKYVEDLDAFVALNSDANVWFYKPFVSAVPEPSIFALMFSGLGAVFLIARRQRFKHR
jgi:hypothetical protein